MLQRLVTSLGHGAIYFWTDKTRNLHTNYCYKNTNWNFTFDPGPVNTNTCRWENTCNMVR